jgi:hypothetical protein
MPLAVNMVDQRREAFGELVPVDLPVAQTRSVVVAAAEPAVIEDEALGAQFRGQRGDGFQLIELMPEIDRLPAIVMHGPRLAFAPRVHRCLDGAKVPMKGLGQPVEALVRPGQQQGGRGDFAARKAVIKHAELHLPPPVGQFLGQHPVTAAPGQRGGETGACMFTGGGSRQRYAGKMRVPGPPLAAFAAVRAGHEPGFLPAEFAAPAPGMVDDAVHAGRRGNGRRGKPAAAPALGYGHRLPELHDAGIGIETDRDDKPDAVRLAAVEQYEIYPFRAWVWWRSPAPRGHPQRAGTGRNESGTAPPC